MEVASGNRADFEKAPDIETYGDRDRPPIGKSPIDCKHERTAGYVYKISNLKQAGLIRSDLYDGELYFHFEEMMQEFVNHKITVGEKVEFTIQSEEGYNHVATLIKPIVERTAYQCLGNRYRGYIRRFAERWGFLNSASFDGDLFVHRDNLLPQPDFAPDSMKDMNGQMLLIPRQLVEFDVMLDERGRAVAKFITTRVPSQPSDWLGLRVRGHIRSFQDRWGFLNSDRFHGDLFIHRDGLMNQVQSYGGTFGPGTIVEFDVEMDNHRSRGPRNRLVARNVVVLQLPNGETPGPVVSGYATWPREQMQYNYMPQQYGGGQEQNQYGYDPGPGYHTSPPSSGPAPWNQSGFQNYQANTSHTASGLQSVSESKEEDWGEWHGGQDKGMTHITIKDWEADGQGQLKACKGQLITVSHEAPHGWVYGTHLKLPDEKSDHIEEGWIPKVMVKRVNLCQAVCDWPGEGDNSTTLAVRKNEWVAISREADRGWVYGDRVITDQNATLGGGWIPKKILQ